MLTPTEQLSSEVRALLEEAPIALNPADVLEAEKNYGTSYVLQRLQEVFDAQYPGWRTYHKYSGRGKRLFKESLRSIFW